MGDIPIWYGVPTPVMVNEIRDLKLVLLEREIEVIVYNALMHLPEVSLEEVMN